MILRNTILRSLIKPLLSAVIDALYLFPLLFTFYLQGFALIPLLFYLGILIGVYYIFSIIRSIFIRKNRLIFFGLVIALDLALLISLAAGLFSDNILTYIDWKSAVLFILTASAAAVRGICAAERPMLVSFPKTYGIGSLGAYFVFYFFYGKILPLQEHQKMLLYTGLATVPAVFMIANAELLKQASHNEQRFSASMSRIKRNNRMIILLTVLFGAFIAGFNTFKEVFLITLKTVIGFVLYWLGRLFDMASVQRRSQGPPPQGELEVLPEVEAKPMSPFWEKVIEIFAIIILAAALLYALYFLGKKIIQLFRYLAELIRRLREESSWAGDTTGYSDEKESLLDWQSLRKIYGDALREWLDRIRRSEVKWEQLTDNRQRIRYLYRRLVLKAVDSGYGFRSFLTPNEVLDDLKNHNILDLETKSMMEDLYGKARYGDKDIEGTQVQMLRDRLEK